MVEDEEGLRALNARGLASRGYTVLEASNGIEAIAVFEMHDGKVDLVVSDVVMPEMDGPTLLKELRGRNPDLKIIFVSGYAEDAFEKSLPQGQQFSFLPKPFTLKQLVEAVKETLKVDLGLLMELCSSVRVESSFRTGGGHGESQAQVERQGQTASQDWADDAEKRTPASPQSEIGGRQNEGVGRRSPRARPNEGQVREHGAPNAQPPAKRSLNQGQDQEPATRSPQSNTEGGAKGRQPAADQVLPPCPEDQVKPAPSSAYSRYCRLMVHGRVWSGRSVGGRGAPQVQIWRAGVRTVRPSMHR